ncbi:hypothetical protein APY03_2536 [Variovorax sp. WDL1]|nr:hypothetical protein APY03_2536 [Variovorax sp. WDL1]
MMAVQSMQELFKKWESTKRVLIWCRNASVGRTLATMNKAIGWSPARTTLPNS